MGKKRKSQKAKLTVPKNVGDEMVIQVGEKKIRTIWLGKAGTEGADLTAAMKLMVDMDDEKRAAKK